MDSEFAVRVSMIEARSNVFRQALEDVSRQLVRSEQHGGTAFIRTPLLYPGGSSVVVRIDDNKDRYFVSDYGSAYSEAEMMGASGVFMRNARMIAEAAGIGFDQHAFFVAEAARTQLPGVVVTVANCSQEAVALAAFKLAERRTSDAADMLFERLIGVFSRRVVARDVEVIGASNTKWHVATLVKQDGSRAIFEPVSNHHNSIFAASTKFHDIADTENPPARIAVIRRKAEFKTYLAVLSQAADVIERDAPNETYMQLAA